MTTKTIDLTPTWAAALYSYGVVCINGTPEGQTTALESLRIEGEKVDAQQVAAKALVGSHERLLKVLNTISLKIDRGSGTVSWTKPQYQALIDFIAKESEALS